MQEHGSLSFSDEERAARKIADLEMVLASLEEENRRLRQDADGQERARAEVHRHLMQQHEIERQQIAHELHDGPLQDMIGISYILADVLSSCQSELCMDRLRTIQGILQQQIREMRVFCNDLRPPVLAPFGLSMAIRSHADALRVRFPQLKISLNLDIEKEPIEEDVRLALYRVYQELVNNIIRHAEARSMSVRLELVERWIEMEINDDGVGFEVPTTWVELARQGHLGLVGILERVEALNGRLELHSAPGQGARLVVRVPR